MACDRFCRGRTNECEKSAKPEGTGYGEGEHPQHYQFTDAETLREFLSQSIALWSNDHMTEMYEVSMTSAWQCILTLLLIAYPSSHMDPQSKCDKEEIFDTYGTYHPCQS